LDEPLAHFVAAVAWLRLGRSQLGVAALREAARLDPPDPAPRELAAEILIAGERPREAALELLLAGEQRDSPRNCRLRRRLPDEHRAEVERRLSGHPAH